MGFQRVRFSQFRNLQNEEISLDAKEIFFVGENGQGKTNFLEGLYLLCFGSSFRTKIEKQLCLQGTTAFSAWGTYEARDGTNTVHLKFENTKKEIRVNETIVRDRKEIVRNIPCIVFTHEDYLFVNGAPERQRFFFDQTLSLYDPVFIDLQRQYKKILKNRNFLLRQSDNLTLEVYEEQLITLGLQVTAARKQVVEEFNRLFVPLYKKISGFAGDLVLHYGPSWKKEEFSEIASLLKDRRDHDRQMNATTSGPHRDRFKFVMEGKNFAETASTGQIRLISLVLRSAQANFFQQKTGRKPLLLLDDVLLELDGERRKRFLAALPEYDQAFFTFLPEEPVNDYKKDSSLVYHVDKGRMTRNG